MMDYDAQLKLQAYLDGELPEIHMPHRSVTRFFIPLIDVLILLFCIFLLMPYVKLVEGEPGDLAGKGTVAEPSPEPLSLFGGWRRFLVPTGALAAVALATLLATVQFGLWSGSSGPDAESALDDSGAFTYRDYSARTTLVWFSYPAENEFAEGESLGSVN